MIVIRLILRFVKKVIFFTNKKRIELSLTKIFSFGYNLNRLFDNNLLFLTKLPLIIKLKKLNTPDCVSSCLLFFLGKLEADQRGQELGRDEVNQVARRLRVRNKLQLEVVVLKE